MLNYLMKHNSWLNYILIFAVITIATIFITLDCHNDKNKSYIQETIDLIKGINRSPLVIMSTVFIAIINLIKFLSGNIITVLMDSKRESGKEVRNLIAINDIEIVVISVISFFSLIFLIHIYKKEQKKTEKGIDSH